MTKIKQPKALTDLEKEEIKTLLQSIEIADNDTIDKSLWMYGRQIVYAYSFGIINESQKKKLSDYRERKESKKNEELEVKLSEKLMILESQYDEPPRIHQIWVITDRIVVASTRTITVWKEDREVANWWENMILEIFKHRTPKTYEYAKKKYQPYIRP